MKKVTGNSGTLCLPVKPQSPYAVIYAITPYKSIYSRMKLDTANFSTCKVIFTSYMMDMAIFNCRKAAAHVSHDTCLATVMDVTSSDDMRTYCLLVPAFIQSLTYSIPLGLCAVFEIGSSPFILISRLQILA